MDYPVRTLNQLQPILVGFRKARKLTQAAVADILGITQQSYAQLEANPSSVSVERLFKVLRVLEVDLVLSQQPSSQKYLVFYHKTDANPLHARSTELLNSKTKSKGEAIQKFHSLRTETSKSKSVEDGKVLVPKLDSSKRKKEVW